MTRRVKQHLTEEEQAALPDVQEMKRVLDAFFDFRRYRITLLKPIAVLGVEYEDFLPCSTIYPLLAPLVKPYRLSLVRRYSDDALAGQLFVMCSTHKYRIRREDGSMGHFDVIRRELCASLKEVPLEESDSAFLLQLMSERVMNTDR